MPSSEKKSYLSVARWRVLSNYLGITRTVLLHCQLIANQIWEFVIVMINTKIGSRWHYINRAHLQIPLDPLLPIEQEFPRLSAYDRAYSGSYHVDLYYRPVSRWMMGHAVKAKRKWLKEDMKRRGGVGGKSEGVHSYPPSSSLFFPCSLTP